MNGFTDHVLMVRPYRFRLNTETATNNYYQKQLLALSADAIAEQAHREFDDFVSLLRCEGVRVTVHQDRAKPDTPDALFPNNWVSFHPKNRAVLYPMFAPNRRLERNNDVFKTLKKEHIDITIEKDYSKLEIESKFLEGTGSMVLDRVNKKAYAALSERTDKTLLYRFCLDYGYQPVAFHAFQTVNGKRLPIYHTNVMMSIGDHFALVGFETMDYLEEREWLSAELIESGKEIIPLSEAQIQSFAGNMLLLQGLNQPLLAMSTAAYKSLVDIQIKTLEKYVKLIHSPLDTIEHCGGGSARCMLAEVF